MRVLGFDIKIRRLKKRAYEAADKSRRGNTFRLANSTGPNREISGALVTLRDRSRHMTRNNGWQKRAVEAIVKHTVGEGIQPAPIGELTQTKKIKDIWFDWAGSTDCDWYGKMNFYGLQELAMRGIAEGGDILVILRWVENNESGVPIKLQLAEGDQLDHSKNGKNDKGIARMGVQYDESGQLSGYWLFDYHPGDGSIFMTKNESQFVEKSDVLHVFEVLRIGQVRGIPFGVAGFMKTADFSDYEDAQLMKQKIAACFAAFVVDNEATVPDKDKEALEHLEPGIVEHLNPGDTVQFANPPSVSEYDSYSTRILQGIAAAYNITYEMLTMDYSRVNFTSGRMAKIDVTANFKSWQYNMMVPQFCAPVWKWFINACLVSGKIFEPIKTDWTAPKIPMLDPVKETSSLIKQREAGMTTLSEIIRENGREPQELFEELKFENDLLKSLGIVLKPFAVDDNSSTNDQNKKDNGEDE